MADISQMVTFVITFMDAEREVATAKFRKLYEYDNTIPEDVPTMETLRDEVGGLMSRLQDVSNALVVKGSVQFDEFESAIAPGTVGAYPDIEDKAYIELHSEVDGSRTSFQIPAPQPNIFLTDTETVDPTETDLATLLTYIGDYYTTTGKSTIRFSRGYRLRTHSRKEKPGVPSARG